MMGFKIQFVCLAFFMLCIYQCLAQERDEWCEGGHDHYTNHTLPHPEDFLIAIFELYGDNITCTIPEEEFDHMLHDLAIGGDHGHDHYDSGNNHRKKRSTETTLSDDHVHETCYSAEDLLTIYSVDHELGVTQDEFINLSPALVQQILQGCLEHDDHNGGSLSSAEIWGYGILSVAIISICAAFGLIIVKWQKSAAYKYILTVMLGLGVGTLMADAIMHLIPHGLGLHDHSDASHAEEGVDDFVWKTLTICLTIWAFLNLQMVLNFFQGSSGHSHGVVTPMVDNTGIENKSYHRSNASLNELPPKSKSDLEINEHAQKNYDNHAEIASTSSVDVNQMHNAPESLGWMIAIGDGFHNFADGLAIGAAFTDTWQVGLGTAVAIFCHELPHEFGDVAAQLSVGWSVKKVLVIQLLSQSSAFLGLFIGIPVSENSDTARDWIMILAAGMFLYVALSDIVPELMNNFHTHHPWKMFAATNLGIFLGILIMLLISIFEEDMHGH